MKHIIVRDSTLEIPHPDDQSKDQKWIIAGSRSQDRSSCTWKILDFIKTSDYSLESGESSIIGIFSTDPNLAGRLGTDNDATGNISELPNEFIVYLAPDDGKESGIVVQHTSDRVEIVYEGVPIVADSLDVEKEVHELRGVFPELGRGDFYRLDNGNIGVLVYYRPDSYTAGEFEVLMEFVEEYPTNPPQAWVLEPEIDRGCPHAYRYDDQGNALLDYIDPSKWESWYTSYDAAVMIRTWISAYCNWEDHGVWEWDGDPSGHLD
jgi:hypothetical protein